MHRHRVMSYFQDGGHDVRLPLAAICSVRQLPANSQSPCDVIDLLYTLLFLIHGTLVLVNQNRIVMFTTLQK